MATPVTGIDSPRGDVLSHCLLLKGTSAMAFQEAMSNVHNITEKGDQIFAPVFPSFDSHDSHTISKNLEGYALTEPDEIMEGPILPEEAVAAIIIHMECEAMSSNRIDNFGKAETLGIEEKDDNLARAVNGMSMFGNRLRSVAWVRKEILAGKILPPNGSTMSDSVRKTLWKSYSEPLKKDAMKIGENTIMAMLEAIRVEMSIKKVMEMRMDERRDPNSPLPEPGVVYEFIGAKKVADLFLEALNLASSQFPNNG